MNLNEIEQLNNIDLQKAIQLFEEKGNWEASAKAIRELANLYIDNLEIVGQTKPNSLGALSVLARFCDHMATNPLFEDRRELIYHIQEDYQWDYLFDCLKDVFAQCSHYAQRDNEILAIGKSQRAVVFFGKISKMVNF